MLLESVTTRDVEFEPAGASLLRRGGGEGAGGGRDDRQSPFEFSCPLRMTISNHSGSYFRNPTTGFVHKDMYDTEPILPPPESSQASCVLPGCVSSHHRQCTQLPLPLIGIRLRTSKFATRLGLFPYGS